MLYKTNMRTYLLPDDVLEAIESQSKKTEISKRKIVIKALRRGLGLIKNGGK